MNTFQFRDIYLDGENVPREKVVKIFRLPPGAPQYFGRSTLIVGSRGCGKTMLFRYLKEKHNGIALHIPVTQVFPSITKQTGSGALEFDFPKELSQLIANKSSSLIALFIADKLLAKQIRIEEKELLACLPETVTSGYDDGKVLSFNNLIKDMEKLPLSQFNSFPETRPLCKFIEVCGENIENAGKGSLLLLFDKTDSVPAPTLIPLIELLDQSSHYVALLGLRPGHGAKVLNDICSVAIPGDHYDFIHLGCNPRSSEWKQFLLSSLEAQVGSFKEKGLSENEIEAILITSRDSPRIGLAICQAALCIQPDGKISIPNAIKDVCENALKTADDSLHRWRRDFKNLVSELCKDVKDLGNGKIFIPVDLEIPHSKLFPEFTKVDEICAATLRFGVFQMPEGDKWTPLSRPRRFEIAPFALWEKENPLWENSVKEKAEICIRRTEQQISHGQYGPPSPTIFIGYRMRFSVSEQFRYDLEDRIKSYPNLAHVKVEDGNVAIGVYCVRHQARL